MAGRSTISGAIGLAASVTLLLAGCQSGGERPAVGGLPGIVTGSQVSSPKDIAPIAAAPVGPLQGGLLGLDIGRSLTEADRIAAGQAEYEALEYGRSGRPVTWSNPQSGNEGKVVVGPTYQVNLLDCRAYTHTVLIGGRTRIARGTACREPDEDWRVVD